MNIAEVAKKIGHQAIELELALNSIKTKALESARKKIRTKFSRFLSKQIEIVEKDLIKFVTELAEGKNPNALSAFKNGDLIYESSPEVAPVLINLFQPRGIFEIINKIIEDESKVHGRNEEEIKIYLRDKIYLNSRSSYLDISLGLFKTPDGEKSLYNFVQIKVREMITKNGFLRESHWWEKPHQLKLTLNHNG